MKVMVASALVLAACSTSPEPPLSYVSFSADTTLRKARATSSFVSYGSPFHAWTFGFGTVDGCASATTAAVELTTLSSVTDIPIGEYTLRTTETPETVPSAYLRYGANAGISGTLTIDTVTATYVNGSFDGMVMLNGTATPLTIDFGAPVCL